MRRSRILPAALIAAITMPLLATGSAHAYHGPTDTNPWYSPASSSDDPVGDAVPTSDREVTPNFLRQNDLTGLDVFVDNETFPSAAEQNQPGPYIHVNVGHPDYTDEMLAWGPNRDMTVRFNWTVPTTITVVEKVKRCHRRKHGRHTGQRHCHIVKVEKQYIKQVRHRAELVETWRQRSDGNGGVYFDINSATSVDGRTVACGYVRRNHNGGNFSGPTFESFIVPVGCVPSGRRPVTATFTLRQYVNPDSDPTWGATDTAVSEPTVFHGPGVFPTQRLFTPTPDGRYDHVKGAVFGQDEAAKMVTFTTTYATAVEPDRALGWDFADPTGKYQRHIRSRVDASGVRTIGAAWYDYRGPDATGGEWSCGQEATVAFSADLTTVTLSVPRVCFPEDMTLVATTDDIASAGYSPEITLPKM